MERFEDTATEDEEEEFIAMQAVDRDTVDEVASEIEEEELPLGSKKAVSLEKPKNMTVHPKSEEERNRRRFQCVAAAHGCDAGSADG